MGNKNLRVRVQSMRLTRTRPSLPQRLAHPPTRRTRAQGSAVGGRRPDDRRTGLRQHPDRRCGGDRRDQSRLVVDYFGTKENLLIEALRYSEVRFFTAIEEMLVEPMTVRERLRRLVEINFQGDEVTPESPAVGPLVDLRARRFEERAARFADPSHECWRAFALRGLRERAGGGRDRAAGRHRLCRRGVRSDSRRIRDPGRPRRPGRRRFGGADHGLRPRVRNESGWDSRSEGAEGELTRCSNRGPLSVAYASTDWSV